ncbi:MAG: hypothetical protein VW886_06285 [Candidatus Heimdallarchaeota archaeon]
MYYIIASTVIFFVIGYYLQKYVFRGKTNLTNLPELWLYGIASYILPIFFLNILFGISLSALTLIHIAIGSALLIIFIISNYSKVFDIDIPRIFKSNGLLKLLCIMLTINYMFLQTIFPLRGWDALNFYIPIGLDYYLRDDVFFDFNLFTLFPSFKAPISSLMISYNMYFSNQLQQNLGHVIFIIMLGIMIVRYCEIKGYSENIRLYSYLIYLTAPMTYTYFHDMVYYQDHIIGFFYAMTMFSLIEKDNIENSRLIFMISFSLSILSKISGYTLFILIILIVLNSINPKMYKLSLIGFLGFLIFQASAKSYVEIIAVVAILFGLLIKTEFESLRFRFVEFKYLVLPTIVGIFWVISINDIPMIIQNLNSQYIAINTFEIQFYERIELINTIYFENNHSINIGNIILVLLLNYWFVSVLLIPKLVGLKSNYEKKSIYLFWLIIYFSIWLVYHGNVSMRYLYPIVMPLMIMIIDGINNINQKLKISKDKLDIIILVCGVINILQYYPLLPIRYIYENFNERIYAIQGSMIDLILLIMVFSILSVKIMNMNMKPDIIKYTKIVLMMILIIGPIGYQTYILADNSFDTQETEKYLSFNTRKSIQEISNFINSEFSIMDDIGIGYNIPGIALFSRTPILDIMSLTNISIVESSNSELVYQNLTDYGVTFIITLMQNHVAYDTFEIVKYDMIYFQQPSNYTQLTYMNDEFAIWLIRN